MFLLYQHNVHLIATHSMANSAISTEYANHLNIFGKKISMSYGREEIVVENIFLKGVPTCLYRGCWLLSKFYLHRPEEQYSELYHDMNRTLVLYCFWDLNELKFSSWIGNLKLIRLVPSTHQESTRACILQYYGSSCTVQYIKRTFHVRVTAVITYVHETPSPHSSPFLAVASHCNNFIEIKLHFHA